MLSDERKQKFLEGMQTPIDGEDAMHRLNRLMDEIRMDTLKRLPVEFRLNYLSNQIATIKEKLGSISEKELDDAINWEYVNSVLFEDTIPNDFNIIQSVHTIKELSSLRNAITMASVDLAPWIKKVCKDCGEEFFMRKGEVDFFKNKSLSIPTRCKKCREKRKTNKNGGKKNV